MGPLEKIVSIQFVICDGDDYMIWNPRRSMDRVWRCVNESLEPPNKEAMPYFVIGHWLSRYHVVNNEQIQEIWKSHIISYSEEECLVTYL